MVGLNCRHIYEDIGEIICPDCGRDTHETDWAFQHALHADWITSGKASKQGWWSI
jgi:hypothetical protein